MSAGRAGRPGRRSRSVPALALAGCGPLAGRLDTEETCSAEQIESQLALRRD
jgi:hypothetical protein